MKTKMILAALMTFLAWPSLANNGQIDQIRELKKHRRNHAIIFITQEGCVYCEYQRKVNHVFAKYTGWHIEEKKIESHPSVRARFNVTGTPTMILVKKGTEQWNPVGLGAVDLPTMLSNTINSVKHLNGQRSGQEHSIWISGQATGVSAP